MFSQKVKKYCPKDRQETVLFNKKPSPGALHHLTKVADISTALSKLFSTTSGRSSTERKGIPFNIDYNPAAAIF
jgi:hypothetical protein